MKTILKSFIPVAMFLFVAIMLGSIAQAYVDPKTVPAGTDTIFSVLKSQVYLTSSTTADLTYVDLVGTTIQPPYRLRIVNVGTPPLYRGLKPSPTATCTPMLQNVVFDEVYLNNPNTYYKTASTVTNLVAEVWTRQ